MIKVLVLFNAVLDGEKYDKATDIYKKYYSTMLYTANSILFDKEFAEDAVSESMIKIIKNLDKISEVSSYRTRSYIVIIVRNTALNFLKKLKAIPEEPSDALDDVPANDVSLINDLLSKENYQEMIKAIRTLPGSLANTLYLSVIGDMNDKQISKILGISSNAVRMRLSRAKKAVRKILSEMEGVYGKPK